MWEDIKVYLAFSDVRLLLFVFCKPCRLSLLEDKQIPILYDSRSSV